ncbi:MAG: glycogen synthase GlgA [Candidatus Fimimonas sp.]
MNIFYFSAEVEPFAKSGGLGDVIGALPKAVAQKGNNVYVVMPYYCDIIKPKFKVEMQFVGYFYTDVNWRHQYVGVLKLERDGVTYFFLDNEYYFQGPMYCFADNERFAYFSKASLDLVCWLNVQADVLHCNDWSTALIPVLRNAFYQQRSQLASAKVVYTIHNLRYQGWMSVEEARSLTGLSDWYFSEERMLQNGGVNLMKSAIVFSNAVTTVSPTYAREISQDEFSEGLGNVISRYSYKIQGILNGVDYTVYNPATDSLIFQNYNRRNFVSGKAANKQQLQEQLNLPIRPNTPVVGIISRLVDQKGLDMVAQVAETLLQEDVQLVVLGTGESCYENMFCNLAKKYPDKVSANIFFDNALAHKIYSASDFILVPSVFEPCGLTQIIALKYGAVPIVRETGGLKDTVLSYNEQTGQGNGFSFSHCNAQDMAFTIRRALYFYGKEKQIFRLLQKRGMAQDFSWKESSEKYCQLYQNLIK